MRVHRPVAFSALTLAAALLSGCGPAEPAAAPALPKLTRADVVDRTSLFKHAPVGDPVEGQPWIAHIKAADLDGDGLTDLLVCDARRNSVSWLRQEAPGRFAAEAVLGANLPAPVHVEPFDLNGDGHLDLLVAGMGEIFPNNDRIGTVYVLENDGRRHFKTRILAERIARVTDVQAADLNGDGRPDLAVGQFGYDQGEIRWMENKGDGTFASHTLLNLSGTINVVIADFNRDGHPDIAAIVSQQYEEIHLFENDGRGNFKGRVIWGSTNEDYACSGMILADLNRDGRPDLVFSNGDGFGPTTVPGGRPWHGVQWLENTPDGYFRFHRVGDLAGAYSPVAIDLDADGAMDVVACSGFNDWSKPGAHSLLWFRNDGRENFTPHLLDATTTHLTTLTSGVFTANGKPSIVSGAFHAYPPHDRLTRLLLWSQP